MALAVAMPHAIIDSRGTVRRAAFMRFSRIRSPFLLLTLLSNAAIAAPSATAPSKPTCFIIPLAGRLGYEVTAEALQAALLAAKAAGARYIVLQLDSPGGSLEEADRLLSLLAQPELPPVAAVVRRADNAAALLPFACRWVFVSAKEGHSAIALPAGDSLTTAQHAELQQQMIQRLRQACQSSGRNTLAAVAMVDASTEYYGDGAGRVGPIRMDTTWQRAFPAGACLSVSPANAVSSGYADGICASLDEVALQIGLSDGWQSAGEQGKRIMEVAAQRVAAQTRQATYRRRHAAEIEQLQKTIREEQRRIQQIRDEGDANPDELSALESSLDTHLAELARHEAQLH